VAALDPDTGVERWYAAFGKEQQGGRFGTPAIWKNGGTSFLICANRIVVRTRDGAIVQTTGGPQGSDASPVIAGARAVFTCGDDHGHGEQFIEAYDLALTGEKVTLTQAWKSPDRRKLTGRGHQAVTRITPLVEGSVLLSVIEHSKNGLLAEDIANDAPMDIGLAIPSASSVHQWAPSPIQAGALVILPHRDGKVEFLKPGKPWTQTCSFTLDAPLHASPFAADRDVFLLTEKSLYCVGAK
jgi:hypothetical protein